MSKKTPGLRRYYVECAMGCGFLVGRGTPKHTCWQCRTRHAVDPIPSLPPWRRSYWKRIRDAALEGRKSK